MTADQKNELNVYADLVKLYPDNEAYLRKYIELLLQKSQQATATAALRRLHAMLENRGEQAKADALITEFPQIGLIRKETQQAGITEMLPSIMQNSLWLRLHQHKLKEGHHLIQRGDHEDTVYLVCEGELAEFVWGAEGKPVLLNLIGVDNVVGESYLFKPGPHMSDIVANKDSVIARLPRKKMLAAIESMPLLKAELLFKAEIRKAIARISLCPLLQNVPLEMRKQLAEVSHTKQYAAGEIIHKAGAKFEYVELVAKGSASFQLLEKGIFKELKVMGPGSLVGESEIAHEQGSPALMVANSSVIVVCIPYAAFTNVVAAYPPLQSALTTYAEKNQSQIMSKLNEL